MLCGLLSSRGLGLGVAVFLAVFLLSAAAGLHVYQCSFHGVSGLSCPGCGLSRAGLSLVTGDLSVMWQLHPFAPYFAILFGTLAVGAVLPGSWRQRWVTGALRLERTTRFHAVLLIGAAVYGAARLIFQVVRLG